MSRQVEQRRLVTVLFADLVGFTFLADDLDPEDTRTVVDTYFARWRRIIEEHGGEVEKFIGDAVMAVFGLRRSYEDDPERAVRAALAMLDDLAELNAELAASYDLTLRMRVGIDTGDVVVSTLGRGDGAFVAVGSTVNRAARIQAAAPVDGILVSDSTQRHVRRTFNLERRDAQQFKGFDDPSTPSPSSRSGRGPSVPTAAPASRASRPRPSAAAPSSVRWRSTSTPSPSSGAGGCSPSSATPASGSRGCWRSSTRGSRRTRW